MGTPTPVVKVLAGDVSTAANTTPVDLTAMTFEFIANARYFIDVRGKVSSAAATTGCGFGFTTTQSVSNIGGGFFHQLANTGTLSGGSFVATGSPAGVSSGLPATTEQYVSMTGFLLASSNAGTAQLQYRSETTAVTTCKAGTTMVVTRIA
jgi:hypothetical protein